MKFDLPFTANPVGLLWVKWRDIEKTIDNFDFTPLYKPDKTGKQCWDSNQFTHSLSFKIKGNRQREAPLWSEDLGVTFIATERCRRQSEFRPGASQISRTLFKTDKRNVKNRNSQPG